MRGLAQLGLPTKGSLELCLDSRRLLVIVDEGACGSPFQGPMSSSNLRILLGLESEHVRHHAALNGPSQSALSVESLIGEICDDDSATDPHGDPLSSITAPTTQVTFNLLWRRRQLQTRQTICQPHLLKHQVRAYY